MLVLALDCSTPRGSVALLEDDRPLAWAHTPLGNSHSRVILSLIGQILSQAGRELRQVEGVAISLGPGSFTGLRVGLATAKGLCFGLGLPLVGVSSLLALAQNAGPREGTVIPMMDARKREVFFAAYGPNLQDPLLDPQAALPQDAARQILPLPQPLWLLGTGARLYQEPLQPLLQDRGRFLEPETDYPDARSVGILGHRRLAQGQRDDLSLAPTYLRSSDAELIRNKALL